MSTNENIITLDSNDSISFNDDNENLANIEYIDYDDDNIQSNDNSDIEHLNEFDENNIIAEDNVVDKQTELSEVYIYNNCNSEYLDLSENHMKNDAVYFEKNTSNLEEMHEKIEFEEYIEFDPNSNQNLIIDTENENYVEYLAEEICIDEKTIIDSDLQYLCIKCNLYFETKDNLNNHMKTEHNEFNISINKFVDQTKNTTCPICNTIFSSVKCLRLHKRMHNPVQLKSLKDTIGKVYKKHFIGVEFFKCSICKKRFDCKLKEEHAKFHQNENNIEEFACSICNKTFTNSTNYKMHLKVHSKPIKKQTKAEIAGISLPYPCQYCSSEFSRPHEKVKHERIHTGEKPFKCEVCGKCFRVSYSLTLHLRTHTTARPYACAICKKKYKSHAVYTHHLLTHSDDRPYKCPSCPKSFKTSVQLHGHKNSHTKPFTCPECSRPFATMFSVKTHLKTHLNGDASIKQRCIICGAAYSRIFALKEHLREVHCVEEVLSDNINSITKPVRNKKIQNN